MTPPTLLEEAKELVKTRADCWCSDPACIAFRKFRAAIAAEEAKPKVERVQLPNKFMGEFSPEWRLYAERPVPPPKEPSIEERLLVRAHLFNDDTKVSLMLFEAAAEIRRLRGKKE